MVILQEVFNSRLGNLPNIQPERLVALPIVLPSLGVHEFEGVYIHGSVPPGDLELLAVKLSNYFQLSEDHIDPTKSRFYSPPRPSIEA